HRLRRAVGEADDDVGGAGQTADVGHRDALVARLVVDVGEDEVDAARLEEGGPEEPAEVAAEPGVERGEEVRARRLVERARPRVAAERAEERLASGEPLERL